MKIRLSKDIKKAREKENDLLEIYIKEFWNPIS